MGAQQSSGGNDDCQPCLGIGAPFRRKSSDPLGSPMPDTPISSRRKRREFSSRYGGLEKEVSTATQSSFYSSSNGNNSQAANVHEGSVRDRIVWNDSLRRAGPQSQLSNDVHRSDASPKYFVLSLLCFHLCNFSLILI